MGARVALSCVLAALLLVVGCSGDESTSTEPAQTGPAQELDTTATVLTDFITDAVSDPIQDFVEAFWGDSEYLFRPVLGDAEQWVAEGVERVDPRTWRIQLRPDVQFQNGKPVDSAAVVAWLQKEVAEDAFAAGALGQPTSIEADGDLGVLVTTEAPFEPFRHGLANTSLPVMDVSALEAVGKDFNKLAGMGIYTGPFALESVKPGEREYVRNENYWDGPVALAGFTLRSLADPQAGVRAVQAGEADIVINPPPRSSVAAQGGGDIAFTVSPTSVQIVAAVPNARVAPFDDVNVRKAFALALDNESIAKAATFGMFPPLAGIFPSDSEFAHDWKEFDIEQAKEMLEDAGWEDTGGGARQKDGESLDVVLYTYTDLLTAVATAMTDTLSQAGFNAEVQQSAGFADFQEAIETDGGVTVLNAESFGFDGNPVTSLGLNYLKSTFQEGPSFMSPPDEGIISLIDRLLENPDPAEVESGMQELGQLNEEGAYYIPIMEQSNTLLVTSEYEHLEPNAFFLFLDAKTAPRQ
jgi:peptide/nickel transport system substrate-binding protein